MILRKQNQAPETTFSRGGSLSSVLILCREYITSQSKLWIILESASECEKALHVLGWLGMHTHWIQTNADLRMALAHETGIFITRAQLWRAEINGMKWLDGLTITLDKKTSLSPRALIDRLTDHGWRFSEDIWENLSYRLRGDTLDLRIDTIWSVRVSFFDESIDGIYDLTEGGNITEISSLTIPLLPLHIEIVEGESTRKDGGLMMLIRKQPQLIIGGDFSEHMLCVKSFLTGATTIALGPKKEGIDLGANLIRIADLEELKQLLGSGHITICTSRAGVIRKYIEESAVVNHESEIIELKSPIESRGYNIDGKKYTVLGDDVISRLFVKRRRAHTLSQDLDLLLHLSEGDYVVHSDHGVGRFVGIVSKDVGGVREYLELHYRDEGKLFVPLTDISKITKYIGESTPQLANLGSDQWKKTLDATDDEVLKIALELLEIHAQSASESGLPHRPFIEEEAAFRSAFPYEHTPDQASAIEDILKDLEDTKTTDRLLVGDVGFGKTEVAMNAIYRAFLNGRQSLVLAPLVVLAYEHHETLSKRLGAFGVKVAVLTRLTTTEERKQILSGLKNGKIHVVVGTHGILDDKVLVRNLGLIVVDEEHRFGVAQKERFRAVRVGVDVLSMSATPIPRSLNLALSWVRKISTLTTPPTVRLPIHTHVAQYRDAIIIEAIMKELSRGGQTIILMNRIAGIEQFQSRLQGLLGENIRTIITHGGMSGLEIEDRIWDFKHRKYDVLISTTIIENGVNFLDSNTIIVIDAQNFGLGQLHQIRWRVGRSDKTADCWLLFDEKKLSDDGKKRLLTIAEHSHLGAGFELALRDMEIRGAGEVLGLKQSGKTAAVGIPLYLKMLEEKIRHLKGEKSLRIICKIDLPIVWRLAEEDFTSSEDKLNLFRDIESVTSLGDLKSLEEEILSERSEQWQDQTKEGVKILISMMRARIVLEQYGVLSVKKINSDYVLEFDPAQRGLWIRKFLDERDVTKRYTVISLGRIKAPSRHWMSHEAWISGIR